MAGHDTSDGALRAARRQAAARVQATRRAARVAAHSIPPQPAAELEHLALAGLRTYRAALVAEEDRVSYWRRILQGRLDTLGSPAGRLADRDALQPALSTEQVQRGRTALVRLVPHHDIPPLPDLAALWERCPPPGAERARRLLAADLGRAEFTLSYYRAALHRALTATTNELIARYHADPDSCLSALVTHTTTTRS